MTKFKILNNGGFSERLEGVVFPIEVSGKIEGRLAKIKDGALVKAGVRPCPMTAPHYLWSFVIGDEAEVIGEDQLDAHLGVESEVEWGSGKLCEYYYTEGKEWRDGVYVILDNGFHVVRDLEDGGYTGVTKNNLRKPETPEQREERERLVAAYDLFQTANPKSDLSYDGFKDSFLAKPYLAIVDKTNYRKS